MIIGVDGFNVESDEFAFLLDDREGESSVGTKNIPEDVAKEGEECSENIKGKNEEKNCDHTNIQATEMEVGVNGFDVKGNDFVSSLSESKGESNIGAKGVPEDVSEEGE